jgi:hypothetical protein
MSNKQEKMSSENELTVPPMSKPSLPTIHTLLTGSPEPQINPCKMECSFYQKHIDIPAIIIDYVYHAFVMGDLFTERYDTRYTDMCDNMYFFPEVYLLLKEMNPSMRMRQVERKDPYTGKIWYQAIFRWDSWSHWDVPKHIFPRCGSRFELPLSSTE